MAGLEPSQVSLLTAMMAISGAIWSLGFVAYVFIWNYLERWVRNKSSGDPKWIPDPADRRRLMENLIVFIGFLADGIFALGSILAGALTIANNRPEWIPIVSAFFALTIGTFVALFSNEIRTSIWSVLRIIRRR